MRHFFPAFLFFSLCCSWLRRRTQSLLLRLHQHDLHDERNPDGALDRGERHPRGYNNAHAQLPNATAAPYNDTAYNNTLCCSTDAGHTLSNNCTNANATAILGLYDVDNSHVQVPGINYTTYGHPIYNYTACMALSPGNLTCLYVNTTCPANYTGIASIASSEPNDGLYNLTNAHIANYTYYTLNVCCKGGNSPPTVPVLTYPVNNNYTVFERNITFQWNASTDPDSDPITYNFTLNQTTCPSYTASALSATNWTSTKLCVDQLYNWSVQACDPYSCSAWAATSNFTIASVVGITFLVNNTNFGFLNNSNTVNTTGGTPPPFLLANTGNVLLNVTLQANNPLFNTSGLGNNTFQYAARSNESTRYDAAQTSWANVSATYTSLFTNLKYATGLNNASVDILITVPALEGAGAKSSTIQVLGNYTG